MQSTRANPYMGQAVSTASPERLVYMLFERCVVSLTQVRDQPTNAELVNRELQRVQDITTELQVALDFERGQPIAGLLASLYDYVQRRIIEANVKKDVSILSDVEQIFVELRDGWHDGVISTHVAQQAAG